MSEKEFINTLEKRLSNISKIEKDEAISYYKEIIAEQKEEGKKIKDIIKDLGNIDDIVQNIMDSREVDESEEKENKKVNIPLLIILSPFILILLVIAFSFFITIYSILISLYITSISLIFAGIGIIINLFLNINMNIYSSIFQIGTLFFCAGFSILLTILTNYLFKNLNKLVKYSWISLVKVFRR